MTTDGLGLEAEFTAQVVSLKSLLPQLVSNVLEGEPDSFSFVVRAHDPAGVKADDEAIVRTSRFTYGRSS